MFRKIGDNGAFRSIASVRSFPIVGQVVGQALYAGDRICSLSHNAQNSQLTWSMPQTAVSGERKSTKNCDDGLHQCLQRVHLNSCSTGWQSRGEISVTIIHETVNDWGTDRPSQYTLVPPCKETRQQSALTDTHARPTRGRSCIW